MTSITPELARSGGVPDHPGDNYLTHSHGFRSWALTLDHKRIGIMYLVGILGAFFVAGIFAELVRTQLLMPSGTLFIASGDSAKVYKTYNQIFTLHGAIM